MKALWWLAGAGALGVGGWFLYRALQPRIENVTMPLLPPPAPEFVPVLPPEARPYANIFRRVSDETGVDAFTLVAIAMRESRMGAALTPPGPGGTGDRGHGRGIMQIDDRAFSSWVATSDWKDPYTNIRKGADVLRQKLAFFQGRGTVAGLTDGTTVSLNPAAASRRGVAAGSYPDPRPLTGTALLRAGVAAYNTGEGNVLMSIAAGKDPDVTTAKGGLLSLGGDYARDVLARVAKMVSALPA